MTVGGVGPAGSGSSGNDNGWRAPAVVVGLLGVIVGIIAPFIPSIIDFDPPQPPPTASDEPGVLESTVNPSPTTGAAKPAESAVNPPDQTTGGSPTQPPDTPPVRQVYLSEMTQPSREVSPNGYLGFGEARSVSLQCNNSFLGEQGRSVSYNLNGLPRSRVRGGLVVESIPNDRIVTIRFIVSADDRIVLDEYVTGQGSQSPIVPFNISLAGASQVSIGVSCGKGTEDRGLFLEVVLS